MANEKENAARLNQMMQDKIRSYEIAESSLSSKQKQIHNIFISTIGFGILILNLINYNQVPRLFVVLGGIISLVFITVWLIGTYYYFLRPLDEQHPNLEEFKEKVKTSHHEDLYFYTMIDNIFPDRDKHNKFQANGVKYVGILYLLFLGWSVLYLGLIVLLSR